MKVIKDNSNKEVKVKCPFCKSKILVKMKDFKKGFASEKYVECPICKTDIWKYR